MLCRKIIPLQNVIFKRIFQGDVRYLSTNKTLKKNHYEVLGVSQDATQVQIKNAYFELSKIYHPDRIPATDENLAKFRAISAAYEVLGNEQSRKLYDRGFIEDAKRIEKDIPEDPNDPIIRFYKQRQQKTKDDFQDMDKWTQEFYKTARKAVLSKNDLFTHWKQKEHGALHQPGLVFLILSSTMISIIILTHFENHRYEKLYRQLFHSK